MNNDERKILARTECLLLWDRLAETGENLKHRAIIHLHQEGVLSRIEYLCGCPLCEYLFNSDSNTHCECCFWPGTDMDRCLNLGSPYREWDNATTNEARSAWAKKVFDLIYAIEI